MRSVEARRPGQTTRAPICWADLDSVMRAGTSLASSRKANLRGKLELMRDIDIRRALRTEMEHRHAGETETLIIDELGMCQGIARVDLAVVNGSVHGYEIKSERDTLTRLPAQSDVYSQALEFVTIVAAPHHLARIEALVPRWWGIWSATQAGAQVRLATVRDAQRNPSLEPLALVQFLWRDEAWEILAEYSLAAGMSGKSRHHLWHRLATSFTVDELGDFVRARLKQRGEDWRALASLA
jgi:hypothetical protein